MKDSLELNIQPQTSTEIKTLKQNLQATKKTNNNNMNAPLTYAPNITIQGNANKEDILEAEKMSQREFEKMYKQQMHNDARLSFG